MTKIFFALLFDVGRDRPKNNLFMMNESKVVPWNIFLMAFAVNVKRLFFSCIAQGRVICFKKILSHDF